MGQFLIYGLIDPRTGACRYVGKSTVGLKRPRQHGTPSQVNGRTRKASWVKSLQAKGLTYGIEILEEFSSADSLSDAERFYVAAFRAAGAELLNETDGGDGVLGRARNRGHSGRRHPDRVKRQIADSVRAFRTGRRHSPEVRAQIAAAVRLSWEQKRAAKT